VGPSWDNEANQQMKKIHTHAAAWWQKVGADLALLRGKWATTGFY